MPQLSIEARTSTGWSATSPNAPRGLPTQWWCRPTGCRSRSPTAWTDRKPDQLAAIASGLASLTQGGARCIDGGLVKQTVVEMDRGLLVVMAISDGSCPTVLAPPPATWGGRLRDDRAGLPRR